MIFARRDPRPDPTEGFAFPKIRSGGQQPRRETTKSGFSKRLLGRRRYADQRTENDDTVTLPKRPAKDGAQASRVGESRSRDGGERPAFAKPVRVRKERKRLRRSWMKRHTPRRIARETPAEREHKRVIRQARVCAVAKYLFAGRCRGHLDVAHLGPGGGTGRLHGDWTQTALICRSHHRQLDGHQRPSVFDGMSPDELQAFKDHEIHLAREFVAGRRTEAA